MAAPLAPRTFVTNVPSNAAPFVEKATGILTPTWYRFLVDLRNWIANGTVNLGPGSGTSSGVVTISSGVILINGSFQTVDTEGGGATDDLDTINGGIKGRILVLKQANNARDVTAKDGTGNLRLAGDFTFGNTDSTLTLISADGVIWLEVARSSN
jgi:hypothetical protein